MTLASINELQEHLGKSLSLTLWGSLEILGVHRGSRGWVRVVGGHTCRETPDHRWIKKGSSGCHDYFS